MQTQTENIQRVTDVIAIHVMTFLSAHLNKEFRVTDLHTFVADKLGGYVAPGSPDRIMRHLRQKRLVDYVVVNRRQSLYRAVPVKGQMELFR
jgi:hypothetical protein